MKDEAKLSVIPALIGVVGSLAGVVVGSMLTMMVGPADSWASERAHAYADALSAVSQDAVARGAGRDRLSAALYRVMMLGTASTRHMAEDLQNKLASPTGLIATAEEIARFRAEFLEQCKREIK